MCYNMDELWKHAKWKKLNLKNHLMYVSSHFYDTSKIGKFTEVENRLVAA